MCTNINLFPEKIDAYIIILNLLVDHLRSGRSLPQLWESLRLLRRAEIPPQEHRSGLWTPALLRSIQGRER